MKLRFETLSVALAEPFVSHKSSTAALRHVLVEIEWEGRVGRGVAVPAKEYTTDAMVRAALAAYAPVLAESSPTALEKVLRDLARAAPGQPCALSAIDMALHDLLGQAAGMPLFELFGLRGLAAPPTALSLGLMGPRESAERARKAASWPILKLKMSAPDEPLVAAVREQYAGRLWIDGNGAWSAKQAVVAGEWMQRHGVELIEQPVAAGHPETLRFVRERVPMMVIADEDCVAPDDVLRLAGCVDGINIKLLKCGGLRRAVDMIALARACGHKVMLGCKTESALGITAMAHLGGLADFLDLDGHLDVVDDPFVGLTVDRGAVQLPKGAGLGVKLRGAAHEGSV